MRKLAIALLFGLIVSMFMMAYADETQNEIASGVVRLHIVANSDEAGDQRVKLMVRDEIIREFSAVLSQAQSPSDAEHIVSENLGRAAETANRVLAENGYSYRAQASLGEAHFPVKHYENITLPPGNYRALRIVLGSGTGQNWWCVMYPPLCFSGEDYEGEIRFESSLANWLRGIREEIANAFEEHAEDGAASCDSAAADGDGAGSGGDEPLLGEQRGDGPASAA